MGMLGDQADHCDRNMRRVIILLRLLNEDNEYNGRSHTCPLPTPQCGEGNLWAWLRRSLGHSRNAKASVTPSRAGLAKEPASMAFMVLVCQPTIRSLCLFNSLFLAGVQESPLHAPKEARREPALQFEGVGEQGGLGPGSPAGGGYLPVGSRGKAGGAGICTAWGDSLYTSAVGSYSVPLQTQIESGCGWGQVLVDPFLSFCVFQFFHTKRTFRNLRTCILVTRLCVPAYQKPWHRGSV